MTLRIGVITDIHNAGPEGVSLPLVERFVEEMTLRFRPDLVVDLGDRIADVGEEVDAERIRQVVERLRAPAIPALFLHGNHDVVHLGNDGVRGLLGRGADYESLHSGDHHVVLLNTQDPPSPEDGAGALSEAQLAWLEQDLRHCAQPVIVFSHHPLDEQDVASHWYFSKHPGAALAAGRARARALLAVSGRVRAVLSGHLHRNHASVHDGIPYLTISSLIERRLSGGQPAGSFAEVRVDDDRVSVEVRGLVPMSFSYP